MVRTALILAFALAPQLAAAQAAPKAPSPRLFDSVTGIVFACSPARQMEWTGAACDRLAAEFRKRAAELKIGIVVVPFAADFARKKLEPMDGFEADKAVRVHWQFEAYPREKDRLGLSAGISANFIWQPTQKDIPNVAPGQRIYRLFYTQGATFDPGATLSKAEPEYMTLADNFFKVGDGKI